MKNIKHKYKSLVKYFISLIKKILFKNKVSKDNIFFDNTKFQISIFNKSVIIFISIIFIYLLYLSIPVLYKKNWLQTTIEKKLLNEIKIDFSLSSDISYEILPSPHFKIKNVNIKNKNRSDHKELAQIKELKIFISQKNLFNKEKLKINYISIIDANFYIQKKDSNFLSKIINNNSFIKKVKIKKSNIFLQDINNETISIIKIITSFISYDQLNLMNILNLKGEIFKTPFSLELNNNPLYPERIKIKINTKKLKLKMLDTPSPQSKHNIDRLNIFNLSNKNLITEYRYKKNSFEFNSVESRIKQLNFDYDGKLSTNPFDLTLNVNVRDIKFSKLIDPNIIFLDFFKSKFLFNKNLSTSVTLNLSSLKKGDFFNSGKIYMKIAGGKVDFNKTVLINDKIGTLKVINSELFFLNEGLKFTSDLNFSLKNLNAFYSLFQTPKKYRTKINDINIKLNYNYLNNEALIVGFKINNIMENEETRMVLNDLNNEKKHNPVKNRHYVNKLIKAYLKGN